MPAAPASLPVHIILSLWCGAQKDRIRTLLNPQKATIVILATLFVSLALAEDFKTVSGKIYKDATISHVEADGIVLRTKTGISRSFSLNFLKTFRKGFITALRRQLERQSRNASTRPKAPIIPTGSTMPIGLRNKSQKSSMSGNRSYRGNTRPARQSRW